MVSPWIADLGNVALVYGNELQNYFNDRITIGKNILGINEDLSGLHLQSLHKTHVEIDFGIIGAILGRDMTVSQAENHASRIAASIDVIERYKYDEAHPFFK